MNLYFLDQPYIFRPISELSKTVRFQKMGMGDIVFFPVGNRLVMVVLNGSISSSSVITDFPMIAQVLIEKELENSDVDLKPILFFDDNYSKIIYDIQGLKRLLKLFHKHPLASKIILETIGLLYHKISQRDASLILEVFSTKNPIPGIKSSLKKDSIISTAKNSTNSISTKISKSREKELNRGRVSNKEDSGEKDLLGKANGNTQPSVLTNEDENSGKLYIVEKLFTPRMKKEYYHTLALGYSEKEALRKIHRIHTKMFLQIFDKLKQENRELMARL